MIPEIEKIMTQKEVNEMFRLLYRLEEHLESVNRNISADKIAAAIRAINETGIREAAK